MALIEAGNLSKVYADDEVETVALRDASLSINSGEFVAIMGPSGSGKSTLLHILGLLDKQTSGTYKFNNKSFDDYTPDELAKIRNKEIGFVFQTFNLLARTSLLNNVMLPLQYSDISENEWRERAKEAIQSVGLAHRMDHKPSELSGGERQRTAIARAVVMNPSAVFADEPTGNLDSASGEDILKIFRELNDSGSTVVLITHEESIAKHAKRIIKIHDGRTVSDEATKRGKKS